MLHVAAAVGDRMTLMLDPACELRTFADALYVGRACDEAGYFWYEDPFRDGGVSAFAHRKLRGMIKTPLLQTEHVRGVEPKADFVLAGGTDFLRVDPEYDMGITGSLKIAHLAEALGLDVEIHACGPAHRHLMSAMRNSNFYEVALVGPDCPNAMPPVYACGYTDQLDCIDADGTVGVPTGPGLGVDLRLGLHQRQSHAASRLRIDPGGIHASPLLRRGTRCRARSIPALAATTLRFGHANSYGEIATDLFQEFADNVTKKTKGEVTVRVFPAEQLGKEADLVQQVKSGALDISAPSMAALSGLVPALEIASAPFLWNDWAEAETVIRGPAFQPRSTSSPTSTTC